MIARFVIRGGSKDLQAVTAMVDRHMEGMALAVLADVEDPGDIPQVSYEIKLPNLDSVVRSNHRLDTISALARTGQATLLLSRADADGALRAADVMERYGRVLRDAVKSSTIVDHIEAP